MVRIKKPALRIVELFSALPNLKIKIKFVSFALFCDYLIFRRGVAFTRSDGRAGGNAFEFDFYFSVTSVACFV